MLFQLVTYAPFTLFPSPVPKSAFDQALAVQVHYNTLVDKISQDAAFLQTALARWVRTSRARGRWPLAAGLILLLARSRQTPYNSAFHTFTG